MMNEEEFDRVAYAYRSWPAHDVEGVAARYKELVELVQGMMMDSYSEGLIDGQEDIYE